MADLYNPSTEETYGARLEREIAEIKAADPRIQKLIEKITEINRRSSMDFDYEVERQHALYTEVKSIIQS